MTRLKEKMQFTYQEVEIPETDRTVIIYSIAGEFLPGTSFDNLKKQIIEHLDENPFGILLSFLEVYYINSGGIRDLVKILEDVRADGSKFGIVYMQESIASVFLSMNLFKLFRYYHDLDSALEDLSQ